MEFGGNVFFIVFDDVDLDQVIVGVKGVKMCNMGEVCIVVNCFIVYELVVEEFIDKMIEMMFGLVVGDGLDEKFEVGFMIIECDCEKVDGLVCLVVEDGVILCCGGEIFEGWGWFYLLMVFFDVFVDVEIM